MTRVVAVRASILLATPTPRRPADARLELVRPLLSREALTQLGSFLRKQQRTLRLGALTALGVSCSPHGHTYGVLVYYLETHNRLWIFLAR